MFTQPIKFQLLKRKFWFWGGRGAREGTHTFCFGSRCCPMRFQLSWAALSFLLLVHLHFRFPLHPLPPFHHLRFLLLLLLFLFSPLAFSSYPKLFFHVQGQVRMMNSVLWDSRKNSIIRMKQQILKNLSKNSPLEHRAGCQVMISARPRHRYMPLSLFGLLCSCSFVPKIIDGIPPM